MKREVLVAVALATTGVTASTWATSAQAATDGVVISELMYHGADGPAGDDSLYDYVELTNTATTPVDVTGWSLTDGVAFTFPTFTLGAGAHVVIAADAAAFDERYDEAPDFVLSSGAFSNGGETIRLANDTNATIDLLAYTDDPPWPGVPDGDGPSLERLDLNLPNVGDDSDADNWLASTAPFGTPGAVNSVASSLGGPRIRSVDDGPARPPRNTDVVVSAEVTNASAVSLEYRVMFGNPVVIAMQDDAASVGGAGDGVYSARVPGQSARTLVRYRVIADGATSQATSPLSSSAAKFHGFVFADPDEPSDLPAFDVFMPPADYTLMLAEHRYDNRKFPITVALGDQVVTDALVRGSRRRLTTFPQAEPQDRAAERQRNGLPGCRCARRRVQPVPQPRPRAGHRLGSGGGCRTARSRVRADAQLSERRLLGNRRLSDCNRRTVP